MPGLRLYQTSYYSNIGANQPIINGTINLGCTRGAGSSTRMYNYCRQHSSAPSLCINDFINIQKTISNSNSPTLCQFYQTAAYWATFRGNSPNFYGQSLFSGPTTQPSLLNESSSISFDSSIIIDKNNNIYVCSYNNPYLYCFNPDCTIKWYFDSGSTYSSGCNYMFPCIGCDGTIYFGCYMDNNISKLFAINPDGTKKWSVDNLNGNVNDSMCILDKNNNVYISTSSGYIYIVNSNGNIINTIYLPGQVFNGWGMSIDKDSELLFINSSNNYTFIINLSNYSVISVELTNGGNGYFSTPISISNNLYVFADDSYVYKINKNTGAIIKTYNTGSSMNDTSPLVDKFGYIYIGTQATGFYKFDQDLNVIWNYNPGNNINTASPCLGSNNLIYLIYYNGSSSNLVCLNLDGNELWSLNNLQSNLIYCSPAIGPNGTIYVALSTGLKKYK